MSSYNDNLSHNDNAYEILWLRYVKTNHDMTYCKKYIVMLLFMNLYHVRRKCRYMRTFDLFNDAHCWHLHWNLVSLLKLQKEVRFYAYINYICIIPMGYYILVFLCESDHVLSVCVCFMIVFCRVVLQRRLSVFSKKVCTYFGYVEPYMWELSLNELTYKSIIQIRMQKPYL